MVENVTGKWIWGTNEELFYNINIYDTREQAIAAGREETLEEGDDTFFVGQTENVHINTTIDSDLIFELISERAYEDVGEAAADYLNDVKREDYTALEDGISDFISNWMRERGYEPNFFRVINIEKVEVN